MINPISFFRAIPLTEQARRLLQQGHYQQALQIARQAVSIDPDNFYAKYYLAYAAYELNNFEPAKALTYPKITREEFAIVEVLLGLICLKQNDTTSALEHFYPAIHLDPSYKEAFILLLDYEYTDKRGYIAQRFYKYHPHDPYAHLVIAEYHLQNAKKIKPNAAQIEEVIEYVARMYRLKHVNTAEKLEGLYYLLEAKKLNEQIIIPGTIQEAMEDLICDRAFDTTEEYGWAILCNLACKENARAENYQEFMLNAQNKNITMRLNDLLKTSKKVNYLQV